MSGQTGAGAGGRIGTGTAGQIAGRVVSRMGEQGVRLVRFLGRAAVRREREALTRLRTAPSPPVGLADLARQQCIACGSGAERIGISRYPAHNSTFFAGLILARCGACGLGWVPVPDLDLDAYYTHHYADEFRPERARPQSGRAIAGPAWRRAAQRLSGALFGPDQAPGQDPHQPSDRPSKWPPDRPRDRALRHAADLARFGPFERVFDIGAGEGLFLQEVAAQEKYAWELDAYSVGILRDELGVTLLQLQEKTDFFDLVMASHALEHFTYDTLPDILADTFRALRPGGIFYVEVPIGARDLDRMTTGKLAERPPQEPHTLFFSSHALNRMLGAAGFELLESTVCPWTRAHVPAGQRRQVMGRAARRDKIMPLVIVARRPVQGPGQAGAAAAPKKQRRKGRQ